MSKLEEIQALRDADTLYMLPPEALIASIRWLAEEAHRYRDALEQIWSMMEPPNSEHTRTCISCAGCLFEWEETLQVVRNVLDGKDPHDHWGEPVALRPMKLPHAKDIQ